MISVSLFCVRMMFQDVLLPRGAFYVCVDFGGEDALMSEHFLYGAQIGAALEKMRGKGMTEGVRTDVFLYAALAAEFLYDVEYHCAG